MFSSEGAGPALKTIPAVPEAEGSPEMERIIEERNNAQKALRRCINMHYNRGGLLEREAEELSIFEHECGAYWDPRWLELRAADIVAAPSSQYNTKGDAI